MFQAVPAKPANLLASSGGALDSSPSRIDRRSLNLQTGGHGLQRSFNYLVLVAGLIIGAIAKLLMPGRDPGGCIITMLLGVAGAFVGTWLGRMFTGNENYVAHWIMSIVGAMLLLFIYRMIAGRRS